jgi:hypothetical protein
MAETSSLRACGFLLLFFLVSALLPSTNAEDSPELSALKAFVEQGPKLLGAWAEGGARNSTADLPPISYSDALNLCRDPYFEPTQQNFIDSNVVLEYRFWSEQNKEAIKAYKNGEIGLFAKDFLGDMDFRCGVGRFGCDTLPSCTRIVQIYNGDAEMARLVYFSFRLIHRVNNYFAAVKVSLAQYIYYLLLTIKLSLSLVSLTPSPQTEATKSRQSLLNSPMPVQSQSARYSRTLSIRPLISPCKLL